MMNRSYISILFLFVLAACKGNDQDFDASGVFEADEVVISSEAVGKILRFEVEEGTSLKAGQVIGSVDCKNLSLQKAQVEASIGALGQKN
jgi:HlyD family secretion protein